jgi:hypothetical protein
MSRTAINFVVDAVAFAAFLFLATTGVLMRTVLPPGSGHFSTLWGMDRHAWGDVHFWIAVTLTSAVALHLFLHWRWIVSTACGHPRRRFGIRAVLAVIAVLVTAGLAVAPFFAPVQSENEPPPHKLRSAEHSAGDAADGIDGSMTLREIEQRTGVSAAVVAKELGLPNDLPTDERLGRLRKQFGFEMHDLREAVRKHLERKQPQGATR